MCLAFRYNSQTDKLHMSYTVMKHHQIGFVGRLIVRVFRLLRLVHVRESKKDNEDIIECSNMTIINLTLNMRGPMHEASLTIYLLIIQVGWFSCFMHRNYMNEKSVL